MEPTNEGNKIAASEVKQRDRLKFLPTKLGNASSLVETMAFGVASSLDRNYKGAYWDFMELTNGGMYMRPTPSRKHTVFSPNGWSGEMSADAFGIVCCLMTFSMLSFSKTQWIAEIVSPHFHKLREYALDHAEQSLIFRAID